jgi:glycosyltransferase involved in cell wall biosynthesis
MSIRVLMVGPGKGMQGGISALVETLVPLLERQVDLLYFPTVKQRPLERSGKFSLRNMALAISQFARFLYALYRYRPQIIHLHTSQGIAWLKDTVFILVGKACRLPVVVHVHAPDFDELYGKQARLLQCYTRKIMGLADAIIAVSTEWRDRLTQITPRNRVFAFRNCIAIDELAPHCRDSYTDGVWALFLGSVGPRKGAFDLLDAMGYVKSRGCSLHLWIAGHEEGKGEMLKARTRLQELQLEDLCELPGIVHGAKKTELLNKASLFVLPSHNEGLPMAVLEAMAAGLAVVTTPVGGIPEVVRDGYNGFLVDPGDVEALADRLAILAIDPNLRQVMGQRSREIAEQELDVKPYVKRLVALYESLVCPRTTQLESR